MAAQSGTGGGMDDELKDTPRWSVKRWGLVFTAFAVGVWMVWRGTQAGIDPSVALELIRQGSSLVWIIPACVLTGAGGERGLAWLAQRKNGGPP